MARRSLERFALRPRYVAAQLLERGAPGVQIVAPPLELLSFLVQLAADLPALVGQLAPLGVQLLSVGRAVFGQARALGLDLAFLFDEQFFGLVQMLPPRLQFGQRLLQLLGFLPQGNLGRQALNRVFDV